MTGLQLIVLAMLSFRLTRLVGWDEITIAPRSWASGLSDHEYTILAKYIDGIQKGGNDPWDERLPEEARVTTPTKKRWYVAKFLHCPWCVGFWISLGVSLGAYEWWLEISFGTAIMLAFALSAIVGLTAKNLDP